MGLNQNLVPLSARIAWGMEMCQLLFIPLIALREKRCWLRWGLLAAAALVWGQLCYTEIFVKGWHDVLYYQNVLFAAGMV